MESYGTIRVCGDCLHHHANGECGDCHREEGHDSEPLSSIGDGFNVAMGMAYEEHDDTCAVKCTCTHDDECPEHGEESGAHHDPSDHVRPDGYECDCETDTYSTSQCEGCGSYLHGERHAMTLFKN